MAISCFPDHPITRLPDRPMRSPSDVHHRPGCRHEIRFADVVALFFHHDDFGDVLRDLRVAVAPAHAAGEVVFDDGEQAGAELTVGGDADAAAMAAERMRHGRDDADLPESVIEAVAARGFTLA